MDNSTEIRLCKAGSELEATMIVNLLQGEGLPARSDATQSMRLFGGLTFEPGHTVYVPRSVSAKATRILGNYPHFRNMRNLHVPGF